MFGFAPSPCGQLEPFADDSIEPAIEKSSQMTSSFEIRRSVADWLSWFCSHDEKEPTDVKKANQN
jgi:hypothetical protein